MADWPETATFLIPEDRIFLKQRIANSGGIGCMDILDSRSVKRIFSDWKIWLRYALLSSSSSLTTDEQY